MQNEAAVICIDNSDFSRNEDFYPNRFKAQCAAARHICRAQLRPRGNTVALVKMSDGVRILLNLTERYIHDMEAIESMKGLKIAGEMDLAAGLKTALLILKNRKDRLQKQRIFVFVGSPIKVEKNVLMGIGRMLKRKNVAIDIMNVGEDGIEKLEKLEALRSSANNNHINNCDLYRIPGGGRDDIQLYNWVQAFIYIASGRDLDVDVDRVNELGINDMRIPLPKIRPQNASFEASVAAALKDTTRPCCIDAIKYATKVQRAMATKKLVMNMQIDLMGPEPKLLSFIGKPNKEFEHFKRTKSQPAIYDNFDNPEQMSCCGSKDKAPEIKLQSFMGEPSKLIKFQRTKAEPPIFYGFSEPEVSISQMSGPGCKKRKRSHVSRDGKEVSPRPRHVKRHK